MKAFIASLLFSAAAAVPADLSQYSFTAYLAEFHKEYDAEEFPLREAIFYMNIAKIVAHNAVFLFLINSSIGISIYDGVSARNVVDGGRQ